VNGIHKTLFNANLMLLKISSITFIASFSLIVPIIMGTINLKTVRHKPYIVLYWYLIVYAIFEVIAWYYALNRLQNHFIANTIIYFDVLCFGSYYYLIIFNRTHKKIIISLVVLTIGIVLWSHFGTNRDYNRMDSFALSIQNIAIITMVLLFFYQLLQGLETKNLFTYSHFWIGIAVLIYYSVVFFVNILAEYVTFNKDDSITEYWDIKQYLTFFHRIFLAIGLWFSKTPIQSNLSSK
jgi:hypothetical protein